MWGLDGAAIDGGNDIAGAEIDGGCAAARMKGIDIEALLIAAQSNTEPWTRDAAMAADCGIDDLAGIIGRDSKADPFSTAAACIDRGIDADDAAIDIDERAAGITGINGSVGLDKEVKVGDIDGIAGDRGDDAIGYGLSESKGVAEGEHDIADLHGVGIAEACGFEGGIGGIEPQDGEIGWVIGE